MSKSKTQEESDVLTLAEVCKELGVSRETVRNRVAEGVLTPLPKPAGLKRVYKLLFPREQIERIKSGAVVLGLVTMMALAGCGTRAHNPNDPPGLRTGDRGLKIGETVYLSEGVAYGQVKALDRNHQFPNGTTESAVQFTDGTWLKRAEVEKMYVKEQL